MLLNCHSYYSLRYGTIALEQLVHLAKEHAITTMALTDINTFNGIYDFVKLCHKANIKPLVGIEFRQENQLRYIALARNENAIAELSSFLTPYNKTETPLPKVAPTFKDSIIIYPIDNTPETLQENEYIGIEYNQLNLLYQKKWSQHIDKMVVLHTVNHINNDDYQLHKILRAINGNQLLSKLNEEEFASTYHTMKSEDDIVQHYIDYPIIIENTKQVIASCNYSFDYKKPKNKQLYTQDKDTDMALLSRLAYEGLERIYGLHHNEARLRVEKELKVINELNFTGYFLITWDIIRYSLSKGFTHIGRGSGANSIIGYCLGITNVCPLELDLYFERFLNENRKSPPDFDIDWSWKDRNTILDYIFNRYGDNHVAFCGAISTFKYRSIIREIGKVYGLPKEELDNLTRTDISFQQLNSVEKDIHHYGQMLEGFPNQRTMHPCGVLISEEPITQYTALDYPPKGYPVAQFDMHIAEDISFFKFDILSQRGIGHINDAVKLIAENKNISIDIHDISLSKDNPKANYHLERGNTLGCFYIESPAMRGLLRRLKCDNYKTLVAASSIIRPGVAKSGMMQEYIFRHNNPTQFEYFHPVFKEQLGETYGIMVYQEDVIKIALHYGGLPATDGDILRRAMSGKTRSKDVLLSVKQRFFAHCEQKGHPRQLSEEIYRQIESFAGYSFCKAHSASYAIESYQSLYLKTYYPLEFITAVINNQGGFYRTEIYVHEAKQAGAIVKPPCINKSNIETTLDDNTIYLGFMFMQGISSEQTNRIIKERNSNGVYTSIDNFVQRVNIGIEALQNLIFIGAFSCFGKQKNELLIQARLLLLVQKKDTTPTLLQEPIKEYHFPTLQRSIHEDAFDEIELLGFTVSCSPFDLLKTKFRGDVMVCDLEKYHKKTVRMVAYLIARKHVPTVRGSMYFGTWIDVNGEYFDTVHFPDNLEQYPFQGGGCYLLLGIVEVEYHFPNIHILKMAKLPFIADPRYHYDDKNKNTETQNKLKEDVSLTYRKPYPRAMEINLPRHRMKYKS